MRIAITVLAIVSFCCGATEARTGHRATRYYHVRATAFSIEGVTKDGGTTHFGIAAADPKVLPLGTRIRVTGAGRYSGIYVVTDTGSRINGRKIDIFIPNRAEAKRFGVKSVQVHVLEWGNISASNRHSGGA
jgi:3D (Asp-Asp-Asp) domain-containing protein